VLSSDDRALVVLHELEGWKVAELAELWKRSEGAIKARLFRARRKMKDEILRRSRQDPEANPAEEGGGPCVVAEPGGE
jgi:DNA-directed RNA polymerase specialized sigma24 family protein